MLSRELIFIWLSLTSNDTVFSRPFLAAQKSAVRPPVSCESTSTFPVSMSILTTLSCPHLAARDNGVWPNSESRESTSTFPVSMSILAMLSCPPPAAHESGDRFPLSRVSTSTFPVSRSILTMLS
ncbi:hypothetical protein LZ31DRAFT_485589 [Colletotrichum somersetense]|nr:hypothetical protein LZ31DRAFT_485589 [Colletotrichum somersetense]